MPLFASVIVLGAFLLFQVQFVLARIILPWFGEASDNGVLAVHVSNKYLDLNPSVSLSAGALGKEARLVDTQGRVQRPFPGAQVNGTSVG